ASQKREWATRSLIDQLLSSTFSSRRNGSTRASASSHRAQAESSNSSQRSAIRPAPQWPQSGSAWARRGCPSNSNLSRIRLPFARIQPGPYLLCMLGIVIPCFARNPFPNIVVQFALDGTDRRHRVVVGAVHVDPDQSVWPLPVLRHDRGVHLIDVEIGFRQAEPPPLDVFVDLVLPERDVGHDVLDRPVSAD